MMLNERIKSIAVSKESGSRGRRQDFNCSIDSSYEVAQSSGSIEYTDCISAEGLGPPTNECSDYDAK